jgi:carbamoylphosphate synthase large subunit
MEDDNIVAIGLLTRTHLRMLGSSLKIVYKAEDTDRFDTLLRALDEADRKRAVSSPVSS